LATDDRRVRDSVMAPGGISESAASLADKLGVSPRRCRQVLDELVKQGLLRRHEFSDIAPMYCRFPTLEAPPEGAIKLRSEATDAADDAEAPTLALGALSAAP
jgi:hypothetical protein